MIVAILTIGLPINTYIEGLLNFEAVTYKTVHETMNLILLVPRF